MQDVKRLIYPSNFYILYFKDRWTKIPNDLSHKLFKIWSLTISHHYSSNHNNFILTIWIFHCF